MSRAFIKEDADTEAVVVTPRPPIPEGSENLVTPAGLAALKAELEELSAERESLLAGGSQTSGSAEVRRLAAIDQELPMLVDRLRSAVLVPTPPQGSKRVTLGAEVTIHEDGGRVSTFNVVGIDEADPLEGKVAFTAPVAAALMGKEPGDRVTYAVDGESREAVIKSVAYDA